MKPKRPWGSSIAGACVLAALFAQPRAYASTQYSLGLETSSFLRSSPDRHTQSNAVQIGIATESKSKWVGGVLDASATAFTDDAAKFGVAAKNAYVHSSREFSSLHKISLGRKWTEWSVADEAWKLGAWSPRFLWDPLHPTTEGKIGIFYGYDSRKWTIEGLVSPISIPETGVPVAEKNGTLHAPGPFWIPMRESVSYQGRTLPLRSDIAMPGLGELMLKPNAALKLRYGETDGGWASVTYGFQPLHQADIAADARVELSKGTWVQSTVHPTFPYRHLFTVESGYVASAWWVWSSLTSERPLRESTDPSWVRPPMGPALIGSTGIGLRPSRKLQMHASYLAVHETAQPTDTKNFDLFMPSRFAYMKAARFEGTWKSGPRTDWMSAYVVDIDRASSQVSVDFRYQPNSSWRFGVGADGIISGSSEGMIGQYIGDDRIRWSVNYAF